MSYSASISILTVISIERYVAIIYPMHSRRMQTMFLLRATVIGVWIVSAATGIPCLLMYDVENVPLHMSNAFNNTYDGGETDPATVDNIQFCVLKNASNILAYNMSNFVLWYTVPLVLMAFVYSRISVVLWRSSNSAGGAVGYNRCPRMAIHAVAGSLAASSVVAQPSGDVHLAMMPSLQLNSASADFSDKLFPAVDGLRLESMSIDDSETASPSGVQVENTTITNMQGIVPETSKAASPDSLLTDADEPQPLMIVYTKRATQETHERNCRLNKQRQPKQHGNKSDVRERRGDKRSRRNWLTGSTKDRGGTSSVAAVMFPASAIADSHGDSALGARRKVIRLLIALVVSFAVCVLPYHVRILWLTFGTPMLESWQSLIPPLTFIMYYLNSALNPILYAFLSNKFRSCLVDLFFDRFQPHGGWCRWCSDRGVCRDSGVTISSREEDLTRRSGGRLRVSFNLKTINTVAT
jgi:7 transmembrane receptor (rhodopsin family)